MHPWVNLVTTTTSTALQALCTKLYWNVPMASIPTIPVCKVVCKRYVLNSQFWIVLTQTLFTLLLFPALLFDLRRIEGHRGSR